MKTNIASTSITLKRNYFIAPVIFIVLIIVLSSYVGGPPPGSTNAPGENTCYGSPACHGGVPNTGPPGSFGEITIMGGVPAGNLYIPNSTYVMMPYLVDTVKQRGGFQIVARLDNDSNAGTVTITMPVNTQPDYAGGYDYVGQTSTGAVKPIMANMHDWMYSWQAPPAGSGTVTFYAAFIAGDGDGGASGDNIYTDTLVLYEDTITGIRDVYNTRDFTIERIYPLPATNFVNIDFKTDKHTDISLSIIDINGKIVIRETLISIYKDHYKLNLKGLTAGIYFVKVKQGDKGGSIRRIVKI